jgi:hypothetical protein
VGEDDTQGPPVMERKRGGKPARGAGPQSWAGLLGNAG